MADVRRVEENVVPLVPLYRPAGDIVRETIEELHLRNQYADLGGLRTGVSSFDEKAREALMPGRVIVVAGESGRGKTALMGQLAIAFAAQTPTMLINLEDDGHDSAKRWLATVSRENVAGIRAGFNGRAGLPAEVLDAAEHLTGLGLDVIDGEALTVEGIARQLWLWKRERGFTEGGAVIIDQLSHVVPTDPRSRSYFVDRQLPPPPLAGERADKTPEWQVWFLSEVAKRLGVTIVLAHQLNNAHGVDVKPTIRSVRDSQGIVHKADLVLIPWRPKKIPNPFAGPGQPAMVDAPETKAFLLGVKGRQVAEFEVEVEWLGGQQRFADMGTATTVYVAPPAPSETTREGARRLAALRAGWDQKRRVAIQAAMSQAALPMEGQKDEQS